ncbi:MAG: dephospho-CoA kinase [Motiliproteus sp.]
MMFVIGLTGGIGSGKTAVANEFIKLGIEQVDADIIAREIVQIGQPALQAISNHFGPEILLPDESLNRSLLRERIFQSPEQRAWLEQLLHPLIRELTVEKLQHAKSEYCILVSPLLLETDQHQLCNHILVVDVPEEQQIERTTRRDNNPETQTRAIIKAQMSRTKRLQLADSVIDNSGPLIELRNKVIKLDQQFRTLANTAKNN